jgi:hypothetical protein
MIGELQISGFMREKVRLLAALGRDIAQRLSLFDLQETGDDTEGDVGPFDERDIAEFLGSLETMERDDAMFEPPSDRWLPRFAPAGLLQATIDDYYRANNSVVTVDSRYGERLVRDPLVAASQQPPTPSRSGAGRLTLNKADPRWVLVLYAKRLKRRHGRALFPTNMGPALSLASDARMLLVGDWASGIPGAVQVADTMRNVYIKPVLGAREVHVVHLGDVYYAGLAKEYRRNLLRHWPVRLGEEHLALSWCIPGNHDMYAGGRTFYDMLRNDRPSARRAAPATSCWRTKTGRSSGSTARTNPWTTAGTRAFCTASRGRGSRARGQ